MAQFYAYYDGMSRCIEEDDDFEALVTAPWPTATELAAQRRTLDRRWSLR